MSTPSFLPEAPAPPEAVASERSWRARACEETTKGLIEPLRALLRALGEDPARDGLQQTPARMARAYRFLTGGYGVDPYALLRAALVDAVGNEMVLVQGVAFFTLSERYLLPFFGNVHVAYIPNGKTIDAEAVTRVIDTFARRLQTQERLTRQIHDALAHVVAPRGVAVTLEAQHSALLLRGPEKQHARLTTRAISGAFRQPENRAAFARLLRTGALLNG